VAHHRLVPELRAVDEQIGERLLRVRELRVRGDRGAVGREALVEALERAREEPSELVVDRRGERARVGGRRREEGVEEVRGRPPLAEAPQQARRRERGLARERVRLARDAVVLRSLARVAALFERARGGEGHPPAVAPGRVRERLLG
jgi:hypothetical protein